MQRMAEDLQMVRFLPSAIHGMGGFASTEIPAGTRIIEYVGEKIDGAQMLKRCEGGNEYIIAVDRGQYVDGSVEWNPARWLNHSCAPNAEASREENRIYIRAVRDIKAGEEITFNYCYDLEDLEEHPCRCGAKNCVGYIVAEQFFTDAVRRRSAKDAAAMS